jgi:tetratricopeptide (TPR) repeat protein
MNTDAVIQRAVLLIEQNRYPMAKELLLQALAEEPDHARAHSWLALCHSQDRDQLSDATREAERAVFLAPDDYFTHYVLATIWETRNKIDKALASINEAISLEPSSAPAFAVRSRLYFNKKNWKAALESAEEGLECDPEDDSLQGLRTIALERLGRIGDAREQAEQARQQDPDSSWAHTTLAYTLLRQGDYRGAQKSFAEALRLSPNNDMARSGMMQALNSSNFLYRWMFQCMNSISRMSSRTQWILIIGLWLGMRLLDSLAKDRPWLIPWVLPLTLVYLLFVMMTWIMEPLFNTMLRFHSFGKFLLSAKERWASNLIAGALAISLVFAIVAAVGNGDVTVAILPVLTGIYLLIPLVVPFRCRAKWTVIVATVIATGFGLLYLAINVAISFQMLLVLLLQIYMFGILIYCFIGQWLVKFEEKL